MPQLIALSVPLQRETPTMAPVMHCVVETGISWCRSDLCSYAGGYCKGARTEKSGNDDGDGTAKLNGDGTDGGLEG